MGVTTGTISLKTKAEGQIIDITDQVAKQVQDSGLSNGVATVFVVGSTGAVTTLEYESGLVRDLQEAFERLAPRQGEYAHDAKWGDGNGYAHVRAAFFKPSLTIPLEDGCLELGTWQQIVLLDFDNRPRQRRIRGQVMGLKPR